MHQSTLAYPLRAALAAGNFALHTTWRAARMVALWARHERMKQELRGLDDATLKDVGLTRGDIERAVRRPFWDESPDPTLRRR
ncbi:MAG: DUF1127 domain-containing protein [Alphaproteobacteria bacterium]